MGFGDVHDKHLLRPYKVPASQKYQEAFCFHCDSGVAGDSTYICKHCDFYIHDSCHNFPKTVRHPLHHQHPLTLTPLFASSRDPVANSCNKCHEPCVEGYTYHCPTCQFFLHLRCFFTLDHGKHNHTLIFRYSGFFNINAFNVNPFNNKAYNCNICGYLVNSFHFACIGCNIFIHYDCILISPTIKHHHVHELTIRHHFPEECNQVYCDICEDKDGELDRTLSYYYCKACDYVVHVRCITNPENDTMLLRLAEENLFCCNQCDYTTRHGAKGTIFNPTPTSPRAHPYVDGDCLSKCRV